MQKERERERGDQKESACVGMFAWVPLEVSLQDLATAQISLAPLPLAKLYSRSNSNQQQPRWGSESRVGIKHVGEIGGG